MSTPSRTTNPNTGNALQGSKEESKDDSPKTEKRGLQEPISVPARTSSSSAKRSDSPRSTKKSTLSTTKNLPDIPVSSSSSKAGNKPPLPPKKNGNSSSSSQPQPAESVPIKFHRRTYLESIIIALVSCCTPSSTKHEEEIRPVRVQLQRQQQQEPQPHRPVKEQLELDILKKEDDRPTTSTGGIPDNEPPAPPHRERTPTPEEPKPTVTITHDAIVEKEPISRFTPPLTQDDDDEDDRRPLHLDDDDDDDGYTTMTPLEQLQAERALRQSMQIQAPFPPTGDESDALVVSPTPQISIQSGTESEESDGEDSSKQEEIQRPFTSMYDDSQPKVKIPHHVNFD
jgi:hypothetical protein